MAAVVRVLSSDWTPLGVATPPRWAGLHAVCVDRMILTHLASVTEGIRFMHDKGTAYRLVGWEISLSMQDAVVIEGARLVADA